MSLQQVIIVFYKKSVMLFHCLYKYLLRVYVAFEVIEPDGKVIIFVVNLLTAVAETSSQFISCMAYMVAQKE